MAKILNWLECCCFILLWVVIGGVNQSTGISYTLGATYKSKGLRNADNCKGPNVTKIIQNFKVKCVCKKGYKNVYKDKKVIICSDIDECKEYPNLCLKGEYCKNTQGGYKCLNNENFIQIGRTNSNYDSKGNNVLEHVNKKIYSDFTDKKRKIFLEQIDSKEQGKAANPGYLNTEDSGSDLFDLETYCKGLDEKKRKEDPRCKKIASYHQKVLSFVIPIVILIGVILLVFLIWLLLRDKDMDYLENDLDSSNPASNSSVENIQASKKDKKGGKKKFDDDSSSVG